MSDDIQSHRPSQPGDTVSLRSMQEVAVNDRDASKMLRTYNVAYWGNNYYDVNELGHISVCPDPDEPSARVDLAQLVKDMREQDGQRLPALFCSHKFCNTVCVRLTPRSNVRVNRSVMRVTTSWFIRLRLTSIAA